MLANTFKIKKCIYQDFTKVFPQTGGLGFPTFRGLLLCLIIVLDSPSKHNLHFHDVGLYR